MTVLLSLLLELLLSCCGEESVEEIEEETIIVRLFETESEKGMGVEDVRVSNPVEETQKYMTVVWLWSILVHVMLTYLSI